MSNSSDGKNADIAIF